MTHHLIFVWSTQEGHTSEAKFLSRLGDLVDYGIGLSYRTGSKLRGRGQERQLPSQVLCIKTLTMHARLHIKYLMTQSLSKGNPLQWKKSLKSITQIHDFPGGGQLPLVTTRFEADIWFMFCEHGSRNLVQVRARAVTQPAERCQTYIQGQSRENK